MYVWHVEHVDIIDTDMIVCFCRDCNYKEKESKIIYFPASTYDLRKVYLEMITFEDKTYFKIRYVCWN